ncbi:Asp23/Gls24 family envelope stress response protein [Pseudonocardiaceae bacterium YIM PH 21723]|nr:Asp23/Gls24 family envelope stress response protein [Pseudonocardiaceae bacterium YIM PH 21723]
MTAVLHAGDLGRTTVSETVVRALATRALREIGLADAKVDVQIRGQRIFLATRLRVPYPQSVSRTATKARGHLTERVGALAGIPVQRVDVLVTALARPEREKGRVR